MKTAENVGHLKSSRKGEGRRMWWLSKRVPLSSLEGEI